MSSRYVRTEIKAFLTNNHAGENQIDLTAQYSGIEDIIEDEDLTEDDNWLGLTFAGDEEIPLSVPSSNSEGLFREFGSVFLHIVEPVQKGVADLILARAEILRDSFRGQRINDVVIEDVDPPNFESGATIQFEGGYTSATVVLHYYKDLKK